MEKIGEVLNKSMPESKRLHNHKCRQCGKEYTSEEILDGMICSDECQKKWDIGKPEREAADKKRINTRQCQYVKCGKEYYDENYSVISEKCYCSEVCKEKSIKARKIAFREKVIRYVVPEKYHDMVSDRTELVNMYVGKNIFITGDSGTGKTVLMAEITKKIIRESVEIIEKISHSIDNEYNIIKWISYPAFIMELQNMFKKDFERGAETPFDMAEKIAKFNGMLCVDDIGAEKLTEFVRQITYFIINEREQRMLPIMITSNFSLAQIDEMIDPRISSRIAGMCETIRLVGKDRRIRT
jgi:DNA replication protein DnaC